MNPEVVATIRNVCFRPVRLRGGYAMDEVDAFLARVRAGELTESARGSVGEGQRGPVARLLSRKGRKET